LPGFSIAATVKLQLSDGLTKHSSHGHGVRVNKNPAVAGAMAGLDSEVSGTLVELFHKSVGQIGNLPKGL